MNSERKYLSADGLIGVVHNGFGKIAGETTLDALMSVFAVFSLKYPSLLALDRDRNDGNLKSIYGIKHIYSDTQIRVILDEVIPGSIRPSYKDVFCQLQRGKALEQFEYIDKSYLLSLDGTGYFSSKEIHCDSCLEKNIKTGAITYSH